MANQSTANRNDRQAAGGGTRQQGGRRESGADQQGYLERGNEQFREMVSQHEGQAVLVALALGFGIGVALGYGMGGSDRNDRWTDRIAAEGVGRRLLERIDSILPDAISRRLNG